MKCTTQTGAGAGAGEGEGREGKAAREIGDGKGPTQAASPSRELAGGAPFNDCSLGDY